MVTTDGLDQRIAECIEPQASGCWLYKGRTTKYGVHRDVYESLVGPIADDCVIHHVCETKGCCNPEHLQVLTHRAHRQEHARLRKLNPPKEPKTVLAVRLLPADIEALAAGAEYRGKTLSQWVREILAAQAAHDRKTGKVKPAR